jgi:hypothetical protein
MITVNALRVLAAANLAGSPREPHPERRDERSE